MKTRKTMKPHEDTWTAVFEDTQADAEGDYPAEIKRSDGSDVIHCDIFSNGAWIRPEDLKLAVQAPAMARLLLKLLGTTSCDDEIKVVLRDAGVIE